MNQSRGPLLRTVLILGFLSLLLLVVLGYVAFRLSPDSWPRTLFSTVCLPNDAACLIDKASSEKDAQICETIPGDLITKADCYRRVSSATLDEELCAKADRITRQGAYAGECWAVIAKKKGRPEICQRANLPDSCLIEMEWIR